MRRVAAIALVLIACGGGHAPAAKPPSNQVAPEEAKAAEPDRESCYPYLRAADGSCPTACETRDDCAGSRGPADFAEHGWPLDCLGNECVPLPPDHVNPR